jgi:2-methylcitrate dehydratase PrpD
MSIPYGVASMLLHGDVGADRFTEKAIRDAETVELARRVTVEGDESIDSLGPEHRYTVRVAVETKDGRRVEGGAVDRPGGPTRPLSTQTIVEKFTRLANPRLGEEGTLRLRELVDGLDDVADVGELVGLLVPATH